MEILKANGKNVLEDAGVMPNPFKMENFGYTLSSNTWPIFSFCSWFVITAPPLPNPTVQKLYEGCKIAREGKADLILAVGGGSVCDYSSFRPARESSPK